MKKDTDVYMKYKDKSGEEYYCPLKMARNNDRFGKNQDDCVEISTVGRYAGNLDVVDRFSSLEAWRS